MPPNNGEILKRLSDDGWMLKKWRGSHRQLVHPEKPGKVTVAGKLSDIPATEGAGEHLPAGRMERMIEREYVVILEPGENCWGAYSPDVPGCIATGATREEAEKLFAEALAFHIEGLIEDGDPIPEPTSVVSRVKVA